MADRAYGSRAARSLACLADSPTILKGGAILLVVGLALFAAGAAIVRRPGPSRRRVTVPWDLRAQESLFALFPRLERVDTWAFRLGGGACCILGALLVLLAAAVAFLALRP